MCCFSPGQFILHTTPELEYQPCSMEYSDCDQAATSRFLRYLQCCMSLMPDIVATCYTIVTKALNPWFAQAIHLQPFRPVLGHAIRGRELPKSLLWFQHTSKFAVKQYIPAKHLRTPALDASACGSPLCWPQVHRNSPTPPPGPCLEYRLRIVSYMPLPNLLCLQAGPRSPQILAARLAVSGIPPWPSCVSAVLQDSERANPHCLQPLPWTKSLNMLTILWKCISANPLQSGKE